jgi:hypothetical protein
MVNDFKIILFVLFIIGECSRSNIYHYYDLAEMENTRLETAYKLKENLIKIGQIN